MSSWKPLLLCAAIAAVMLLPGRTAHAQVVVDIGVAPVCPYGYFDYAPYDCAPYGYYGPDWFVDGVFLGAGPWFHGPHGFHGHVDNRFDPRHGYRGPVPSHGAQAFNHFQGNEARDGHGSVVKDSHSAANEHALPGYRGGGSSHASGGGGSHASGGHPR
ncbi:MAG: hypothetical protein WBY53_14855 [Acidobacteriaceae bacterium]